MSDIQKATSKTCCKTSISNIVPEWCSNRFEILLEGNTFKSCWPCSLSTVISSKDPKILIKAIFNSWVKVYSAAENFMSKNGGEFADGKFWDIC